MNEFIKVLLSLSVSGALLLLLILGLKPLYKNKHHFTTFRQKCRMRHSGV